VQYRGHRKANNGPPHPLGERIPSHHTPKVQFSLTQQTHQHSTHMEWGLGGGIGANV